MEIYLGIGGNLGQREAFLRATKKWIEVEIGVLVKESSIYATAAWGMENAPDFLNQVVCVETDLSPDTLLGAIRRIERRLGRVRRVRSGYASRTADIDLLLYGDQVFESEALTVPHPGIPERRFVLEPLAEIAPGLQLPGTNNTIAEVLQKTPDTTEVRIWSSPTAI